MRERDGRGGGRGVRVGKFCSCCVFAPICYCLCQSQVRQSLTPQNNITHPSSTRVLFPPPLGLPAFLPAWRSPPFYSSTFIFRISTIGYWDGALVGISSLEAHNSRERISLDSVFND